MRIKKTKNHSISLPKIRFFAILAVLAILLSLIYTNSLPWPASQSASEATFAGPNGASGLTEVPLSFQAEDMVTPDPMVITAADFTSFPASQGPARVNIVIPELGDYVVTRDDIVGLPQGATTLTLPAAEPDLLIDAVELRKADVEGPLAAPTQPTTAPTQPSKAPKQPSAGDVTFNSFQQNGLPVEFRSNFGCGGAGEAYWLDIATSWSKTWTVSSRSEFDSALKSLKNGERILIKRGTNLGTDVELASSGSPNAKKYIMGESSCGDTAGSDTFSGSTRFTIPGNDWVVMNLKFASTGNGRAFDITGARNWVYNNRLDNAGEVLFTPKGTAKEPKTTGNRVVGNFFNGDNDKAGVRMLNPFTGKNEPSMHDLVIGANTFENYTEAAYQSKVITDTTFGWNYPYGSATDIAGADTYTELGWNHFINAHGEVPTSKTSRWMIHDNLYEVTPSYGGDDTPHISLRAGDNKLVFRNIFLDGSSRVSSKSIKIAGARSQGYYNVTYRTDNRGLEVDWTTEESFDDYPFVDKTWMRNERVEDIDWRYNFFLGDGDDTATWAKVGMLSKSVASLPPRNNTIKDNFYSAEDPSNIGFDFHGNSKVDADEADWIKHNPDAVRGLQHLAKRSGSKSTLSGSVKMPTSVTVKDFWLDNRDITITLPPWIAEGSGGLIDLVE